MAVAPAVTLKVRTWLFHDGAPNEEALRPSSQSSIWRALTDGTLRACADATIASAPLLIALSVCMFAVNTP